MTDRYGKTELLPGDWGLVRTGGIAAKVIRFVTRSSVNHAFRYVGDGQVVEATPHGTISSPLSKYKQEIIWSSGKIDYSLAQRILITNFTKNLVGKTEYSWVGVIVLGLAAYGVKTHAIEERLKNRRELFCSQEIDYIDEMAGVHLFDDGRLPGEVTPQDLYTLLYPTERNAHAGHKR